MIFIVIFYEFIIKFNLYLEDKTSKLRKLHSVLTCQMENNRKGCINRDYNGCLNMKKIFNHYMKTNERPLKYCRGYDLIKDTNLSSCKTKKCQVVSCS